MIIMVAMLMVTIVYDDHDDYGDVVASSTCSGLLAKVIMIVMIAMLMVTVVYDAHDDYGDVVASSTC